MQGVPEALLLCCVGLFLPLGASSLLMLKDYPVSLYHQDSRFATVLWFRPPYCLYELWAKDGPDSRLASRQTASMEMQVKVAGDEGVYKATQRFPIPICRPVGAQSLALGDHAYKMGSNLACLNDTCLRPVLPGQKYRVRFLLYSQETAVAATGWSQRFRTQDTPRDFRTIDVDPGSYSAATVVITAGTGTALLLLLGALGLTLITRLREEKSHHVVRDGLQPRRAPPCIARSPLP